MYHNHQVCRQLTICSKISKDNTPTWQTWHNVVIGTVVSHEYVNNLNKSTHVVPFEAEATAEVDLGLTAEPTDGDSFQLDTATASHNRHHLTVKWNTRILQKKQQEATGL